MKTLTLETCELHLFNDLGVIALFSILFWQCFQGGGQLGHPKLRDQKAPESPPQF
jgi:hypothetical protein